MHFAAARFATFSLSFATIFAAAAPPTELDFLTGQSDFARLRQMLPDYSRREAFVLLNAREARVGQWTAADVVQRKQFVRESIIRGIGGLPERTPLNSQSVGMIERDGYRIEKIIFESQPRFFVTANLYLPNTGRAPYPAILFPLGHEEGAKANPVWQQVLGSLAKKGYVALAWDTLGQGERVQLLDEDFGLSKVVHSTTEHTVLGTQTLLVGDALARYTIWDGIRALDYLLSRKEVDAARVGITGNSGGGTHTAYISALDDRIQVAAPSCFVTSWRRLLESIGPQDAEQCIPGFLAAGLDHADFLYAFAPKPFLMLSAIRDFFSISGARETFAEARNNYALAGAPDHIAMLEADDGHGYSKPRRLAAYQCFDHWLQNLDTPAAEPEIQFATEDELNCTPTGQVNTALGSVTVSALNRQRAQAFHRAVPSAGQVLSLIGYHRSESPLHLRGFGPIERAGYRIEKLVFESEPGILVPSLLYIPEGGGRKSAVVLVHGRGKAAANSHAEPLVRAGRIVLSIDARGFGETRSQSDENGSDWTTYFGEFEGAMTAILMNRTLTGMRALDITRAVDVLAARDDVLRESICGLGVEGGAIPLLHAAAADPRIRQLGLERMLLSYQSVVDRQINQGVFEHVIPGVLKAYDLPDLAGLLNRQIWLVDAVDPMQNVAPIPQVQGMYAKAAGKVTVVRRRMDDSASKLYPFGQ